MMALDIRDTKAFQKNLRFIPKDLRDITKFCRSQNDKSYREYMKLSAYSYTKMAEDVTELWNARNIYFPK